MSVALGKLVIDVAALNWSGAAKSGLEAIALVRRRKSVVRRATRRAIASMEAWRSVEGVTEDECLQGLQIAERAIGALSAEAYVHLALEHGRTPEAVTAAILKSEIRRVDAVPAIAARVLETTLTALLADATFSAELDDAVTWATGHAIAAEARHKQESILEAEESARARSRQFEEALRRHSRTRVVALSHSHKTRDLRGNVGSELSSRVTRAETWRTELRSALDRLRRELFAADRRSRSGGQIGAIDLRGSYDAAHNALLDAAPLFRRRPEHEHLSKPAHLALKRLRQEVNEPRYRTALLLAGRWGAGKSRVLAEIASSVFEAGPVQLLLRPLPGVGGQLDTAVLAEALAATGRSYASLVELRNDLKERNARAVVLVDDAERFLSTREELDRVTQLMLDLTEDDRIRWILTVDSWRLDRVLSPDSTPRWDRMSAFALDTRTISKWIDLDASQLGQLVGGELIFRELAQRPVTSQSMAALLDVPLNAWLFIDAARAADQPTAVEDFDRIYWNQALDDLTSTRGERNDCRAVRAVLEQLFTDCAGRPVPLDDVYERGGDLTRDAIDDAIYVLGDARLVSVSKGDFVCMETPALWASGISRRALAPGQPLTKSSLQSLLSFVADLDAELAAAVASSVLLEASKAPEQLALVVRTFLRSKLIPEAGIWVAALNDATVRRTVLTVLREQVLPRDAERQSAHDTYLLLRLLELADASFPLVDVLRLLAPSYATIGDNGLQLVLHQVLHRLSDADVETTSARSELLIAADGIQRARAAKQFAERWVSVAGELVSPDQILTEADSFLRSMAKYTNEDVAAGRAYEDGRPDTAPLALHLIDATIRGVVGGLDPEYAYDLLAGRGWLEEDDWRDELGRETRRACHVAVGKSFADDAQGVVSLLSRLVRGDWMEQESAVFILRHTGPTFGTFVQLPEILLPFAVKLNESKRLDRDIKTRWVRPMLNPPDA